MSKPISTTLLLILALFLVACGQQTPAPGGEQPLDEAAAEDPTEEPQGLCSNAYYPVVLGATWTYNVSGAPTGDFTYTDTITDVRADGFTLTSSFPDGLTRTQEWACTPDGLVALEFGGGSAAALSGSGMTMTLNTTNVTGVTLPSDLAVGSSWSQSWDIEGNMEISGDMSGEATGDVSFNGGAVAMENVSTPAGSFDAIKLELDQTFNLSVSVEGFGVPVVITGNSTLWYAPGVGFVKSVDTSDFLGTAVMTTIELQSYSIP